MQRPLKYIFAILVIVPFVIFSVYLLFGKNQDGNYQMFDTIGNTLESAKVSDAPNAEISLSQSAAPIITYNQGAQEVDTMVEFKSMFTVTTENGTKNGAVEDDFALYLSDIRSVADLSVVEFLNTEQIEALEEIPAAFLYDKEKDILYFHQSGIFIIIVNVYSTDGSMAQYEFVLPVEVKE